MIRIAIGAAWKTDPEVLLALRRAAGATARTEAAHRIVDAMAVEVDGVDIGAGQTEAPVLSAMEDLVDALARLCSGDGSAAVHFQEGLVELLLRRQGSAALLSVVRLARPARLLAREVEVDLEHLVQAAQEAAASLCRDLADLQLRSFAACAGSILQRASRLSIQPETRKMQHLPWSMRLHQPRLEREPPFCSFDLRDDAGLLQTYAGGEPDLGSLLVPGQVTLRTSGQEEAFSVSGVPFLLLRDLAEAAARLVAVSREGGQRFTVTLARPGRNATLLLSVDLARGEFSVDDRPAVPCAPLSLARAFLETAVDFCETAVAQNPAQAKNGYVVELSSSTSDRLAHLRELLAGEIITPTPADIQVDRPEPPPRKPLGPGRLKRLAFEQLWQVDVGPLAGGGLAHTGDLIAACGSLAALGLDPVSGAVRWRGPGAVWSAMTESAVLLARSDELECIDSRSGAARWSRSLESGLLTAPYDIAVLASGSLLLSVPGALLALDPESGRLLWSFEPPTTGRMATGAAGEISIAAADNGFLYGIDAHGRLVWRLRSPGQLAAQLVTWNRSCLALFSTDRGGSLVAFNPATGRRDWEAPLDCAPVGVPVPVADRVAVVAGMVAGDPVVTAIDTDGRTVWTSAPTVGSGPLAISPFSRGLIVKSSRGACAAIDPAGETLWVYTRESAHPPPGNLPARALRGIALVSSEQVVALDLATGAPLGTLPMTAPVRMLVGDDLAVCAADAEGVVSAAQLKTHLSVV